MPCPQSPSSPTAQCHWEHQHLSITQCCKANPALQVWTEDVHAKVPSDPPRILQTAPQGVPLQTHKAQTDGGGICPGSSVQYLAQSCHVGRLRSDGLPRGSPAAGPGSWCPWEVAVLCDARGGRWPLGTQPEQCRQHFSQGKGLLLPEALQKSVGEETALWTLTLSLSPFSSGSEGGGSPEEAPALHRPLQVPAQLTQPLICVRSLHSFCPHQPGGEWERGRPRTSC